MKHVVLVCGTRPDIIKLHPVYAALRALPALTVSTIASGQHVELADETFEVFGWQPDIRLWMTEATRASLPNMLGYLIGHYGDVLHDLHPDLVLVHGDVVTALAGAQAAFLQNLPVAHVEAGLRSSRFEEPFPEEGIRRLIAQITTLHFAPTEGAAQNLYNENIAPASIFVTGNTVVDALLTILAKPLAALPDFLTEEWRAGRPLVLVTCHRRESWGAQLHQLAVLITELSERFPDVCFLWPLHPNPKVGGVLRQFIAGAVRHENFKLLEALPYHVFAHTLASADIVLTDSGGVLEEATVLGKRTFVLRQVTERPEAFQSEQVTLVGYDFSVLHDLLAEEFAVRQVEVSTPLQVFGDGKAGERIAAQITKFLAE